MRKNSSGSGGYRATAAGTAGGRLPAGSSGCQGPWCTLLRLAPHFKLPTGDLRAGKARRVRTRWAGLLLLLLSALVGQASCKRPACQLQTLPCRAERSRRPRTSHFFVLGDPSSPPQARQTSRTARSGSRPCSRGSIAGGGSGAGGSRCVCTRSIQRMQLEHAVCQGPSSQLCLQCVQVAKDLIAGGARKW